MSQKELTKEELLKESFELLPKVFQDSITESGWEKELRRVAQQHHLRIDEETFVENMTLTMMLGLIDVEEYAKLISENIDKGSEDTQKLLEDINEAVFRRIKALVMDKEAKGGYTDEDYKDQQSTAPETLESSEDFSSDSPSREDVLRDIEDPEEALALSTDASLSGTTNNPVESNSPTPSQSISDETQVQKRSTEIPANLPVDSTDPVSAGLGGEVRTTPQKSSYKGSDPYREPIE